MKAILGLRLFLATILLVFGGSGWGKTFGGRLTAVWKTQRQDRVVPNAGASP
jgi:hypothetical protein